MDSKKPNRQSGNEHGKHDSLSLNRTGNKTRNVDDEISSDPIQAEKDEVKTAEENLRSKTNKKK